MATIVAVGHEAPRTAFLGRRGVVGMPGEYYPEYEWVPHSTGCVPEWKEHQCFGTRLSLSEQSIVLNSVIENLYKGLAELIQKRNSSAENGQLEGKIAALFQSIRTFQKQEGGLVKEVVKLHFAGPIAQGWAAIKDVENFLEDYENSSPSNAPS